MGAAASSQAGWLLSLARLGHTAARVLLWHRPEIALSALFLLLSLSFWHLPLFVSMPDAATAFYWIRHDLTFGIYVPTAVTVIVYLTVRNLRSIWQNLDGERGLVAAVAAGGAVVLIVCLWFAVPADFVRPTALPGYMLNAAGRAQGEQIRKRLGLVPAPVMPLTGSVTAPDALYRNAELHWPRHPPRPADPKDPGEPVQVSELDKWPVVAAAPGEVIHCTPPGADTPGQVPDGVSPRWFLDVCSYFKTWRLDSLDRLDGKDAAGARLYSAMPAKNLAVNHLVFIAATIVLIQFVVFSRIRASAPSRALWRALIVLVLAAAWLPLRYYAESFINFQAPRPVSIGGYPAYVSFAVALFIGTVATAFQCINDRLKLWAQLAMALVMNLVAVFIVTTPERANGIVVELSTWPPAQFWTLILLVVVFCAWLLFTRPPSRDSES